MQSDAYEPLDKSLEWQQIGERIRALIKARGWTHARFGELVELGRSEVSLLLSGRPVSEEKLDRIAWALGVSRAYLRYDITDGLEAQTLRADEYAKAKQDTLDRVKGEVSALIDRLKEPDDPRLRAFERARAAAWRVVMAREHGRETEEREQMAELINAIREINGPDAPEYRVMAHVNALVELNGGQPSAVERPNLHVERRGADTK